ncbi:hypothetical protein AVEN_49538-1 [Araneus ventricosus]|uniref:Mos1 transposase HTH domain-containing protein n=1 Tax=Araneus ventricosus TaxID=182803 RepID=A0A4Y2EDT9_ARAVE|nr:hypothetical protein AVEN_49538-1 [Araneus ventricosus]
MSQSTENPTDCEIRSVIRFLNAKCVKAAEIHRQISEVYEESIMREGMVRKWVTDSKDGRTHVRDGERRWRPSVITEDLVQKIDGKFQRTDALGFHLYLLSFLKLEVFFMEL